LDVYSETWPRWGTMRAGECWAQLMPVLRTSATASGLWLTPSTVDIPTRSAKSMEKRLNYREKIGRKGVGPGCLSEQIEWSGTGSPIGYKTKSTLLYPTPTTEGIDGGSNSRRAAKARGMWPTEFATPQARDFRTGQESRCDNPTKTRNLNDQIAKWPTPTACDHKGTSDPLQAEKVLERGYSHNLSEAVAYSRKWPTPNASDHIQRKTSASWKEKGRVNYVLSNPEVTGVHGGQLNPTWVEWLMGWPLEWTDLKPLATDKYQQWLRSHGKC